MNIKVKAKAAAVTAGLIISAIAGAELIRAGVNLLTTEQLTDLIGYVFVAALVYSIYRLVLVHFECKETLKKIQDSRVDQ